MENDTLDLPKLPPETDGAAFCGWAKFPDAREKEELTMLTQTNLRMERAAARLMAFVGRRGGAACRGAEDVGTRSSAG
jgi:hypothetical protein